MELLPLGETRSCSQMTRCPGDPAKLSGLFGDSSARVQHTDNCSFYSRTMGAFKAGDAEAILDSTAPIPNLEQGYTCIP